MRWSLALVLGVLFALPRRGDRAGSAAVLRTAGGPPAAGRAVVLLLTGASWWARLLHRLATSGPGRTTRPATTWTPRWPRSPRPGRADARPGRARAGCCGRWPPRTTGVSACSCAARGPAPVRRRDLPAPHARRGRPVAAGRGRPRLVLPPGPVPGCGWPVPGGAPTALPLGGSLIEYPWTAELSYTSAAEGVLRVALRAGRAPRRRSAAGTHTVYVRLPGSGDALEVSGATADMGLCVGSGVVGDPSRSGPAEPVRGRAGTASARTASRSAGRS